MTDNFLAPKEEIPADQFNIDVSESRISEGGPAKKSRVSARGCPKCQHRWATPVRFTAWGGYIGPKLLSHVKCDNCGATYNRKTGKSNLVPIAIYGVVVSILLFAFIFAAKTWALKMVQS